MSRSGLASPGGSTAFCDRWIVRSALVKMPVFSPHVAAGRTTSAYSVVSFRYRSWTTTNRPGEDRVERIRSSSGRETAGLVPEIQRNLTDPCSAYRKIYIAGVGGP